jgi:thiol-disulfide isomerase/thioredoxin
MFQELKGGCLLISLMSCRIFLSRWQKPMLLTVIALLGLGCESNPGQGSSAPLPSMSAGNPASEFVLRDLQGRQHSLAQYRGKFVLLHFWATWCSPCVVEMPALERLAQRYRSEGLEVVSVNVDSASDKAVVEKFIDEHGLSLIVLLDPAMSVPPRYGVTGYPESFFIDGEGRLISFADPLNKAQEVRIIGERPWDSSGFIEAVAGLMEKK